MQDTALIKENAPSSYDAHDSLTNASTAWNQKASSPCHGPRFIAHQRQESIQIGIDDIDLFGINRRPTFTTTKTFAALSERAAELRFSQIDDRQLWQHDQPFHGTNGLSILLMSLWVSPKTTIQPGRTSLGSVRPGILIDTTSCVHVPRVPRCLIVLLHHDCRRNPREVAKEFVRQ